MRKFPMFFPVIFSFFVGAVAVAETITPERYNELREQARQRKRHLVFHSDGVAMNPDQQYLESKKSVLPYVPGTQTTACTYSLIHQFPVARLYRSKAATEHPPGIIDKLYGDGPDGLDQYIKFCHANGYEAFWAMRTNDTHDSGNDEHGKKRLQSNRWKLENINLLVGESGTRPPFAGWTAYDYAQAAVRQKVLLVLEEVCQNYEIDGIVLDFFRHLPTFKSTAWGNHASHEECEKLTSLLRETRAMLDKIGTERGRPILFSTRTPDGLDYCRALGVDVQQWMKEGLIDIWIATGYFRLQEWEKTVQIGHQYNVQVWASMDESRVVGRESRNSLEVYRARIMNAWQAGVDAVWIFNFSYYPGDPQFQLLYEGGDPATLAFKDKTYFADGRGKFFAKLFLKEGESFFSRPTYFSPQYPCTLKQGVCETVRIQVSDDLPAAEGSGYTPRVAVQVQAIPSNFADHLAVDVNGHRLDKPISRNGWAKFSVDPSIVRYGSNEISIAGMQRDQHEITLHDIQMAIEFHED